MKTSHLTVVLTLTCLLDLGMSARAEDGSSVVVSVPFEFVAGEIFEDLTNIIQHTFGILFGLH